MELLSDEMRKQDLNQTEKTHTNLHGLCLEIFKIMLVKIVAEPHFIEMREMIGLLEIAILSNTE